MWQQLAVRYLEAEARKRETLSILVSPDVVVILGASEQVEDFLQATGIEGAAILEGLLGMAVAVVRAPS